MIIGEAGACGQWFARLLTAFNRHSHTKNRKFMLTKKCYSKPELSAEQFTPNAYIALCNFTAVFHCTIAEGYYCKNDGWTGKDYYQFTSRHGAKDGKEHGHACSKTIIESFNKDTGVCSGYEFGWGVKKGNAYSQTPTFNWYSAGNGYTGSFTGGYGSVGAYVCWKSSDEKGTDNGYIHEGYVEEFQRSGNFS